MSHEYFKVGTTQALINAVKAHVADKPDGSAYAPDLTAGAALGITGDGPTDSAAWLQRVSTADGPTTVKSIHGRTLRWNQLCDRAWTGSTKARVTTSDSDGTMTVTTTSDSSLKFVDFIVTAGHTYLIKGDYTTSGEAVAYGTYDANNNYDKRVYLSGEVSTVQHVADLLTTTSTYNRVRVVNFGTSAASGASCTVKNLMLFDLTVIFGSGNEPTVAEFEAMYPDPYYAYDAGSLLPVNMTGIATTGFNQWDEVWETGRVDPSTGRNTSSTANIRAKNLIPVSPSTNYVLTNTRISTSWDVVAYDANGTYIKYLKWGGSVNKSTAITTPDNCHYLRFSTNAVSGGGGYGNTYQHDICLNLSDPNRNGEYAPYWHQTRTIPAGTLRSAGSVYDEQTATERTIRIGAVDLGTLDWESISAPADHIWRASLSGVTPAPKLPAATVVANAEIAGYTCMAYSPITKNDNRCFAIGDNGHVVIVDSAYSTAQEFAAAMSGRPMFYELATPTATPYDPPLNMTYRTEQGGTERVMVPTGELSAPPTIVAAQGYTAESLRDAALSAIATVENGLASTNYAVGSYLVHGGTLCKVTTAIATGEAISIGTNVTATTVMAEVIALIAQ